MENECTIKYLGCEYAKELGKAFGTESYEEIYKKYTS